MRTGCAGIENQRYDWPQQLDAVKAITTKQKISATNSHNKAKKGRQKINNTIGLDRKVDRKSTLRKSTTATTAAKSVLRKATAPRRLRVDRKSTQQLATFTAATW
jgi:hypothetical protein